jgi:AbrB family looped-hinge helix DNA binding protein
METATSKLTRKYQATIPERVRRALQLAAGDAIAFDVDDGQVRLRKAGRVDLAYAAALQGTLNEWDSVEDDETYAGL